MSRKNSLVLQFLEVIGHPAPSPDSPMIVIFEPSDLQTQTVTGHSVEFTGQSDDWKMKWLVLWNRNSLDTR